MAGWTTDSDDEVREVYLAGPSTMIDPTTRTEICWPISMGTNTEHTS